MSTSSRQEPFSSDEVLLEQFRKGDVSALKEIVNRHAGGVKAFVLGVIKDEPTADILIEEIFMKLIRARKGFTHLSKISPWLILCSRNTVLQYVNNPEARILMDPATNLEEYLDACLMLTFPGKHTLKANTHPFADTKEASPRPDAEKKAQIPQTPTPDPLKAIKRQTDKIEFQLGFSVACTEYNN